MVQTTAVRLGFTKTGKLRFISHLDLARTMSRVLLRAGVPIWYTEGYNPRPKMVFSLPLSIGTESVCEFIDFKITEDMPLDEIAERVSKQFAPEMKVNGVWYPVNEMQKIEYAEYDIELHTKLASDRLAEQITVMVQSPIIITKKSKGKEKEVDIQPLIRMLEAEHTGEFMKIKAMLSCNAESYLNPELFVKAVCDKLNIDTDDIATEYYTIVRTGVKLADGVTDFR